MARPKGGAKIMLRPKGEARRTTKAWWPEPRPFPGKAARAPSSERQSGQSAILSQARQPE